MLQRSNPSGTRSVNRSSTTQNNLNTTTYIDEWLASSQRVPVTEPAYLRLDNHEQLTTVHNIASVPIHYLIQRKTLRNDNGSLQKKLLEKKQDCPTQGESCPAKGTCVVEFENVASVQVWDSDRNEQHYTPYLTGSDEGLGVYLISDLNGVISLKKTAGPPSDSPFSILIKNRTINYNGPLFVTVKCGNHVIEKDINATLQRDICLEVPALYTFTLVQSSGPGKYVYVGGEGIEFDANSQQIVVGTNSGGQLVPYAIEKIISKYEATP
jgi:hypothetical protein